MLKIMGKKIFYNVTLNIFVYLSLCFNAQPDIKLILLFFLPCLVFGILIHSSLTDILACYHYLTAFCNFHTKFFLLG